MRIAASASIFVIGTSLAIAMSGATRPAGADTADAARGQQIAQRLCSGCHATGRTGPSPLAAAPPFRTLSSRYPVESLAEALAEGIRTGHTAMPEFRFSPLDVGALIAYLNDISKK